MYTEHLPTNILLTDSVFSTKKNREAITEAWFEQINFSESSLDQN